MINAIENTTPIDFERHYWLKTVVTRLEVAVNYLLNKL